MRRFRTQWLALFGALVILSLSLGSAFGARPIKADGESLTFGQQVSAFVHSLQSADQDADEDQDEDPVEECDTDGDSPTDEMPDEDSGETPAERPATPTRMTPRIRTIPTTSLTRPMRPATRTARMPATPMRTRTRRPPRTTPDEDAEDSEESEDSADSAASNHGQCVAEVAHDPEAVGDERHSRLGRERGGSGDLLAGVRRSRQCRHR